MLRTMPYTSGYDTQSHETNSQSLSSLPSHHPHFLSNATNHHCLTTLKGYTTSISSLTLAGKFLYSGSSDEIRSWKRNHLNSELQNHDQNLRMLVGKGAVKSIVVLADKLFTAHQDHKIRAWKIINQEPEEEQQKYTHLASLPTLSDRVLKILSPKNKVQIRKHKSCTWVHHVDTVSGLALSTDKSLLYSVSWDRTLKIWTTSDFKCLESIVAHDDAINSVTFSNGDVYTGSADKKIKIWRKNSGEKKHSLVTTLEKHKSGVNALAVSNNGSILYSGGRDRSIVVWEKDGSGSGGSGGMVVMGVLEGHKQSILCLVVVADLVCSGSADKSIRIWRGDCEKNYCCLAVLEGHKGPEKCLTATIDDQNLSGKCYLIYSGSLDCDIKVWQLN